MTDKDYTNFAVGVMLIFIMAQVKLVIWVTIPATEKWSLGPTREVSALLLIAVGE